MSDPIKIIVISDTHGYHSRLAIPDGDILIHAGDMTEYGTHEEVEAFDEFLGRLPHRHKLVVAGNHEICLQDDPGWMLFHNAVYLEDEAITVEGIRFYGSPYQPWFHGMAFNLPRGPALKARWQRIPASTDILITHTPPFGQLDTVDNQHVGCQDLLRRVREIKPRFHVFGHIHECYGQSGEEGVSFINACSWNPLLKKSNPPVVIEWRPDMADRAL
jgi:Icc-related predicted phosphoesterase